MRSFIKTIKRLFAATLCVAALASPLAAVQAAKATPASDTLTRLMVSLPANHEIVFKTPTGVDAPADTITIAMPNFTFGVVGLGDIDLFHGPVTGFENVDALAAVPGVNVWGVTVIGTNITFTAPTNAAPGTVPANDLIAIRIGTNAVGGVNQLTNPAAPVAALVTIGGTFGDANSMAVAILSNDGVSVTAVVLPPVVPPPGGGGGGVGGGGPPPVISNVQAINITSSTASIVWLTDINASSLVGYGFTISYASGTVTDSNYVISHDLNLTGLTPNTTYHFYVSSQDPFGNTAVSGDFTFTTLPPEGDIIAPIISNLQVINISDTSALVIWDTNEPATSFVSYGLTTSYGSLESSLAYTLNHAVLLTGLTPNTLYHFFVSSSDGAGNMANSPDGTFTTLPDRTPPSNVYNLTATPGDTVVTLNWINPPDPDFAGTRIVRKEGGYPTNPFDGTMVYIGTGNTTLDTGLTNGVTYYYGAFAFDTSGNFASGALASATPTGVRPPLPPPISPTAPPPLPPTPPQPPPAPPTLPPTVIPPGVVLIPPPAPGQPGAVAAQYYGAGGTVLLAPDISGNIWVLAGSPIIATVLTSGAGMSVRQVTLAIGGSIYALQPDQSGMVFSGSFVLPYPGRYQAIITVIYDNNTAVQINNTLVAQRGGQVVEAGITGPTTDGVGDATVQLYREINGAWVPYGSPQTSRGDGSYAFMVPNGRYYALTSKDGYRTAITDPRMVERNVFNDQIPMIRLPFVKPEQLLPFIADQVSYALKSLRATLDSPAFQFFNGLAGISLLTVAFLNTASAITAFNILAFLQYLFTQPILLFGRKRKKQWGVVYNSLSKMPVDLAIVRLVDFDTKQAVQTRVTDKDGRFVFFAKKGNYLIEVMKPGYLFPTIYLKDKKEDVDYMDLYHGIKIELDQDTVLTPNIPLDPVVTVETPKSIIWRKFKRQMQYSFAFSAVPLSMIILVISPGLATAIMLLVQVVVYIIFVRIAMPSKPKSWGVTFDASSRQPLAGAIIRIFDKKFNKLLETQVTNQNGRYGFFVRRNIFFVTAEKIGYERYTSSDIDLSNKNEAIVDNNIALVRAKK